MASDLVPVRDYMDDETIQWRTGKPDYKSANAKYMKEKINNFAAGSLAKKVENIVKTWEMEASHKKRAEDWKTVIPDKFTLQCNGGKVFTLKDVLEKGAINISLDLCGLYQQESFQSSYDLFNRAFPGGFPWEVTELIAGPPVVTFKWRHWGTWEGKYKGNEPTGDIIEIFGTGIARVDEDLKIMSVEIFYDPAPMMEKITGFDKTGVCPFKKS